MKRGPWGRGVVTLALAVLASASGIRPALAGPSTTTTAKPATTTTTAPAATSAQLQALLDQEDNVVAQMATVQKQLQASLANKAALDAKVAALDQRIGEVQQTLNAAQSRLESLSAEEVADETQLSQLEGVLNQAKDALHARAIAAYTNPTATGMADFFLRAQTVQEITDSAGYFEAIIHVQQLAVKAVEVDKAKVDAERQAVETKRDDARRARDLVASQQSALESARADEGTAQAQVSSEVATEQTLMTQLAQARAQDQAQIAALQSQSQDLAAILKTTQAGQTTAVSGHGVFMEPVPGAPITSPYGPRIDPIFGDVRFHTGIDFGAPEGTPLHAGADGVVVLASAYGGYGNATVIDHGNGLATLYGHQSQFLVKAGDHVTRGQIIGLVGCTGYCTGPHVHFEVRVDGTPVDPAGYL